MSDKTEVIWHHVTPLFLFPLVLRSGGIRCGADLSNDSLPRRESSHQFDDMPLEQLGGRCLSDCVLLFRKAESNLLKDKLSKTRSGRWKSFPHIVVTFNARDTIRFAGSSVHGSISNVGRTLRDEGTLSIEKYTSYRRIEICNVEEIILPVDTLSERRLPTNLIQSIRVFSKADEQLVKQCLGHHGLNIQIEVTEKAPYVEGQQFDPGSNYLAQTSAFIDAFVRGDQVEMTRLMSWLSENCFD